MGSPSPADTARSRVRQGIVQTPNAHLAYEDRGDPAAPPLLLIMGLGAQMLLWPDGFCDRLVAAGLRVIRFDNRDVGLSGRYAGGAAEPALWRLALRAQAGLASEVPYTLADMADDTAALLDGLGLARAHIAGASMGGMIAQILAARHPQRVATLTILFSSTNQPLLPPPAPRLLWQMLNGPGPDATLPQQKAHARTMLRAVGSDAFPPDEAELNDLIDRLTERSGDMTGTRRQLMAVLGSGDLRPYARRITAPTLVIHGTADRMLPEATGRAVARAIAHATYVRIPGMGHDLPRQLWPELVRQIAGHVLANPT